MPELPTCQVMKFSNPLLIYAILKVSIDTTITYGLATVLDMLDESIVFKFAVIAVIVLYGDAILVSLFL